VAACPTAIVQLCPYVQATVPAARAAGAAPHRPTSRAVPEKLRPMKRGPGQTPQPQSLPSTSESCRQQAQPLSPLPIARAVLSDRTRVDRYYSGRASEVQSLLRRGLLGVVPAGLLPSHEVVALAVPGKIQVHAAGGILLHVLQKRRTQPMLASSSMAPPSAQRNRTDRNCNYSLD